MADKFKKVVTPRGEAFWAHLVTPEVYEGEEVGYTVKVKFSKEDTDKLCAVINEELEAFKELPEQSKHKFSKDPNLGYSEDAKTGDILFKFKANSSYKDKVTGAKVPRKAVAVFDSQGKRIKGDIGNGSIIICSLSLIPYWISTKVNGIKCQLEAVQVVSLQEYGVQSAEAFGFKEVEGYRAEETDLPDIPNAEEETIVTDGSKF